MAMTIQDLRDNVRFVLDTDDEELPDIVLDPWCVEAQTRIRAAIDSWYQLQSTWTLSTTQGKQAYVDADYAGYPEYPQLHGGFDHHVTALDLLFHTGRDAVRYMKTFADTVAA